jgi:hypothetical protein
MRKLFLFLFLVFIILVNLPQNYTVSANTKFWGVQSIDTMKFSRDKSREDLDETIIDSEVREIADIGATHVAIDTPYDSEFLPRLRQWVTAARKYNLNVWFRGNFSGWEGWFSYPKNMTRDKHLELTKNFILDNSDLFHNGDIFTACPECENGGPGDPRQTGDVGGFRKFMIDEYHTTSDLFKSLGKDVITNYNSMNGDVVRLIMDQDTTIQMGGVVAVDHYVAETQKLANDIDDFAKISGGKVVLAEFGSPIPDITGGQTEAEQAVWIKDLMEKLADNPNLIGVNYWVGVGGSTALWHEDLSKKLAVNSIRPFYKPNILTGQVLTNIFDPVDDVAINYLSRTIKTDKYGMFQLPYTDEDMKINLSTTGYKTDITVSNIIRDNKVIKIPSNRWVWGVFDFKIW